LEEIQPITAWKREKHPALIYLATKQLCLPILCFALKKDNYFLIKGKINEDLQA